MTSLSLTPRKSSLLSQSAPSLLETAKTSLRTSSNSKLIKNTTSREDPDQDMLLIRRSFTEKLWQRRKRKSFWSTKPANKSTPLTFTSQSSSVVQSSHKLSLSNVCMSPNRRSQPTSQAIKRHQRLLAAPLDSDSRHLTIDRVSMAWRIWTRARFLCSQKDWLVNRPRPKEVMTVWLNLTTTSSNRKCKKNKPHRAWNMTWSPVKWPRESKLPGQESSSK